MIKGDLYCKNCFVRLFKEKGNYMVFGDKNLPKGVAGAAAANKSADGPNPNVVRPSVAERVDKMAPADFAAAQKRAEVLAEEKAPADEPAPEPAAEAPEALPEAEASPEASAEQPAAEPVEQASPDQLESVPSEQPIEAASEQVEVAE